MPPPVYHAQAEPDFNPAMSTERATGGFTNYRFFLPGANAEFYQPVYDSDNPRPTVFRPFPCRSFSDPYNSFEPYRKDPGGRNYFGFWRVRIPTAWKIGNPSTSFFMHNPFGGSVYDPRLTPLSILCRAIMYAVKKGQGKAKEWASMTVRRPFNPDPQTLLEWDGMMDGEAATRALLSHGTDICLMQGAILLHGGEPTPPGQPPIGWGKDNKTCVFGITSGCDALMLDQLNAEVPNYRGDPANFEARYVDGDPVALESGRYLYVYPKTGDPRKAQYQSQPTQDAFANTQGATTTQRSRGAKKRDDIGYGCHFEKSFQGRTASLAGAREMVRDKWIHWQELLWFPTQVEQAHMLGNILPAAALVYAFAGEHDEWLSPEVRSKAVARVSAQVPAAPPGQYAPPAQYQQPYPPMGGYAPPPPGGGYAPPPAPGQYAPPPGQYAPPPAAEPAFGDPWAPPANPQAPPPPTHQHHQGAAAADPFGGGAVADPGLPAPPALPDAGAFPASPFDAGFDAALAAGGVPHDQQAPIPPSYPMGAPMPPPLPSASESAFGFDPMQSQSGGTAAALAAAKAKMGIVG